MMGAAAPCCVLPVASKCGTCTARSGWAKSGDDARGIRVHTRGIQSKQQLLAGASFSCANAAHQER